MPSSDEKLHAKVSSLLKPHDIHGQMLEAIEALSTGIKMLAEHGEKLEARVNELEERLAKLEPPR